MQTDEPGRQEELFLLHVGVPYFSNPTSCSERHLAPVSQNFTKPIFYLLNLTFHNRNSIAYVKEK